MKWILLFFVLTTLFFSCKKKQPEMKDTQVACDCIEQTNANFKISELFGLLPSDLKTETDTAYIKRNILFSANQDGNEYEWHIGSELIFTKDVGRYFSENFANQDISVTLIVKRKVNKICFPLDDGIDSVTKVIHFAYYDYNVLDYNRYNLPWNMDGKYVFKNTEDPTSDSIVVEIDMFADNSQVSGFKLINLYGQQDTLYQFSDFQLNYRGYKFYNGIIAGTLIQGLDGDVTFDFIDRVANPEKDYLYKGRKL